MHLQILSILTVFLSLNNAKKGRFGGNELVKRSVMSQKTFSQFYYDQQISPRQQLQFKKIVVGGAREVLTSLRGSC